MARPVVEHIIDGMQICRRCEINKPVDQFYKNKSKATGIIQYCKQCSGLFRQETRIRIKNGTTKHTVGLYIKNSPEYKNHTRNQKLRYNHGITSKDYNKMFADQKGCCAVCKTHQSQLNKILHVDHDHITGNVRGLLCHYCNTGLGLFKDNIEILQNVIQYLQDQVKKDLLRSRNLN